MSKHNLRKLEWDSQLFGYPVGSQVYYSDIDLSSFPSEYSDFRVVYLTSKEKLNLSFFEDVKVYFELELSHMHSDVQPEFKGEVEPYIGKGNQELIALAFESGKFSRFSVDQNFNAFEFEKLYFQWIIKSLSKEIAEEVLLVHIDGIIAGFVSLKINDHLCEIGLLATSSDFRRQGVGKQLIDASVSFAVRHGKSKLVVPTQLRNLDALNFYGKMGFKESSRDFIYHIWNNDYTF